MKCFLIDTPVCNKNIILKDQWVFQAYDYDDKDVVKVIVDGINPILSNYVLYISFKKQLTNYFL